MVFTDKTFEQAFKLYPGEDHRSKVNFFWHIIREIGQEGNEDWADELASKLPNRDLELDIFKFWKETGKRGYCGVAKVLLDNNEDIGLDTAAYQAGKHNRRELIELLLKSAPDRQQILHQAARGAAYAGIDDLVQQLLEQGADPADVACGAIEGGHLRLLEPLIPLKYNFPLTLFSAKRAIEHGRLDALKLLPLDKLDNYSELFFTAGLHGRLDIAAWLETKSPIDQAHMNEGLIKGGYTNLVNNT